MSEFNEDNFQLNIIDGYRRPEKEANNKGSFKLEKVKLKKLDKKTKVSRFQQKTKIKGSTKAESLNVSEKKELNGLTAKKRKHQDDNSGTKEDAVRKRARFSTLFAKNPTIPQVDSTEVEPVKEAVFTDSNFSSVSLHPFMVSNLDKMGIKTMTAVQQQSFPIIMSGRDILVKSQTGSGKTLSYAIPIVQHLQSIQPKISRTDGPYCIVIVPTRELALQSFSVLTSVVKPFVWVVPGCIMGGEKRKSEKARLKKGINILVATPGRLVDHLDNTSCLDLAKLKYLVIDEADRMLDLGYEKDISRIIMVLNKKSRNTRQTILLSATLTADVEKLAGMSLRNPYQLDVSHSSSSNKSDPKLTVSNNDQFATPENLHHHFVVVPTKLRLVTLASFLLWKCQLNSNPCKVIVFLSTQDAVEFHFNLFNNCFNPASDEDDDDDDAAGSVIKLFKLYGDMAQKDRTQIFNDFRAVKSGVLLCTDVASRGLDLPHIDWIVQYNTPGSPSDYIHRVGRTARIGSKGNALLFLIPEEVEYLKVLTEHKINVHKMDMKSILKTLLVQNQTKKIDLTHKGNKPNSWEESAAFLQAQFEEQLNGDMNMRTLARNASQSYMKAYTTYPKALKHIFEVKKLHKGHVASSFALTDTPTEISRLVGRHFNSKAGKSPHKQGKRGGKFTQRSNSSFTPKKRQEFREPKPKRASLKFSSMSEFDSGF